MLEKFEKFKIIDINGRDTKMRIEVNWNSDDKKSNECKILKLTFPDGNKAFIKKELLFSLLFTIGSKEEQRKMIPQKLTKVRWYETILGVKATKDIRKGEMINFPIKISLPNIEEEIIREIKQSKVDKKSQFIIP